MKVLYIAAECKPFSKAGGVGDVAGELPMALKAAGVDIEIVTPRYGPVAEAGVAEYRVQFHGASESVCEEREVLHGVPVCLLQNATYFSNDYTQSPERAPFAHPFLFKGNYGKPYVDSYPIPFYDDALRFSFFSEACLHIIETRKPDIVHVNDWVLGYLFGRMAMERMPQKRVLTIHNVGYQGNLGRDSVAGWDIARIAADPAVGHLFADPHHDWNSLNALRLAMELADEINTVSPNYMREMTQPEDQGRYFEGGKGLHEVAARCMKEGRLHGILNGFEYQDPADDATFSAVLERKEEMKAALSDDFAEPKNMLLGFVGRAVEQKFKLLAEHLDGKSVLEWILDIPGVNVAVLATGLRQYEDFLRGFQGRRNFSATIAFDRTKAQQISLGSDVFLMPSLFEPCGITQMESLNCATPPLVRWTGGLVDTVRPHTSETGTGFGFDGASAREVLQNLVGSVHEAVTVYRDKREIFSAMQRRGFEERFLWSAAARTYVAEMYEPAMKASR